MADLPPLQATGPKCVAFKKISARNSRLFYNFFFTFLKHTAHILQTPAYLGQNLAGEKDPHAVFYRVKIRSSALTIRLTVYEFSKIANFHSNPMSGLRSTRMDHQRPPHQALHWEVPGYKRGPGRPRTNWRGVIKNDLEKMGLAWEKKFNQQLSTDKNVIGVWLNAPTWMRNESRSSHPDQAVSNIIRTVSRRPITSRSPSSCLRCLQKLSPRQMFFLIFSLSVFCCCCCFFLS